MGFNTIRNLEVTLHRCFDSNISESERKEAETALSKHTFNPNKFHVQCTFLLQHASSDLTRILALSLYENSILAKWYNLKNTVKKEIRDFFFDFLASQYKNLVACVSERVIKTITKIALLDWPHNFPEMTRRITKLITTHSTTIPGLKLLENITTEFASKRSNTTDKRKQEIQETFGQDTGSIVKTLVNVLRTNYKNDFSSSSIPRKRAREISPIENSFADVNSMRYLHMANLSSRFVTLRTMVRQNTFFASNQTSPALDNHLSESLMVSNFADPDSEKVCKFSLKVLIQLVPWLNNKDGSLEAVMHIVLKYTGLSQKKSLRLAILAMECVNQIMERGFIPENPRPMIGAMIKYIGKIVEQLGNWSLDTMEKSFVVMNEIYRAKFIDFIKSFLDHYLTKMDNFSWLGFQNVIDHLVRYTLIQPKFADMSGFLDIWSKLLDGLSAKPDKEAPLLLEEQGPVKGKCMELLNGLLGKVKEQVSLQDVLDFNLEKSAVMTKCYDIIAKVSAVFPNGLLENWYSTFTQQLDHLERFHIGDQQPEGINKISIDICVSLKIFERISDVLVKNSYALPFVEKIISVMNQLSAEHLYEMLPQLSTIMTSMCLSLKQLSGWMREYQLISFEDNTLIDTFRYLYSELTKVAIDLINSNVPEKLKLEASTMLLWITTVLRSEEFFSLPIVKNFLESLTSLSANWSINVKEIVYKAISNSMLLPDTNTPEGEQNWDSRLVRYSKFMQDLIEPALKLKPADSEIGPGNREVDARQCILDTYKILSGLVESIRTEGFNPKRVLFESLGAFLPLTIEYLELYMKEYDVLREILGFLVALFDSLTKEIGMGYVGDVAIILLGPFTRDQMAALLMDRDNYGIGVVNMSLKVLIKVVEICASKSTKSIIPAVTTMCLEKMYPVIVASQQYAGAEYVKPYFYQLIFTLLYENFGLFFPSSKPNWLTDWRKNEGSITDENLKKLFDVIMQSFNSSNPYIINQNIRALETLNETHGLFNKELFQNELLKPFLSTLFTLLMNKPQEHLKKDIVELICKMIAAKYEMFSLEFLPEFLATRTDLSQHDREKLLNLFQRNQDSRDIKKSLYTFTHDANYYQKLLI
ncbi:Exportin-6 [Basidiobolus ranarum]|uniref:Exportin-6 n=1 Tax=Basidiobolus ranarum TaxID=34480 RepID=A0ABR2WBX9_9FUNG